MMNHLMFIHSLFKLKVFFNNLKLTHHRIYFTKLDKMPSNTISAVFTKIRKNLEFKYKPTDLVLADLNEIQYIVSAQLL